MDIRDWPMDQVMQLPDCCFGRRFVVSVSVRVVHPFVGWDISELALPERCVIWELVGVVGRVNFDVDYIRLALGDQLPTGTVMVDALDPLIPGLGLTGAEPRRIINWYLGYISLVNLRMPIATAGRRLVMEVVAVAEKKANIMVVIAVSSIPREVPDCLVSR